MSVFRHPGEGRDPREPLCFMWVPAFAGMTALSPHPLVTLGAFQ
jgi:hypothetical protein